jgi:hypothetical protein
MHVQAYRLWPRRPRDGTLPLGLSCDEAGLSLAGNCELVGATIDEAGCKTYRARPLGEISALLFAGYGVGADASRLYPAFQRIASYLTRGELALAGIAALHLRIPDLPNEKSVRDVAAVDLILNGAWDSTKHPRWPAHSQEGRPGEFRPTHGDGLLIPVSDGNEGKQPRPLTPKELNQYTRAQSLSARRQVMGGVRSKAQAVEDFMEETGASERAGGWLGRIFARFLSRLDNPKTLEELKAQVNRTQAENAGYEKHHIVEEGPNAGAIPDSQLQGDDNVVSIPYYIHRDISDYYSTSDPDLGGMTPRDYLRGKSFEEQYQFGLRVMRRFGALK